MATYDDGPVFGSAVNVTYGPAPVVRQENGYFGLSGVQSLHGGTRGTQINVRGVLSGMSYADVVSAEQTLNSYVDGIGRTFVDNFGRSYDNTIVLGFLTPDPMGIRPSTLGYSMPYTIQLMWLG